MIDANNFENAYWNLIQVLAWIHSNINNVPLDDALVKISEETLRREIPTSSEIEDLIMNKDPLFPGGLTWVDRDYDGVLHAGMSNALSKLLKEKIGDPNWFDDIENKLIQELQKGEITCYGLEEGEGQLQPILDILWINLCFWYETPHPFAGHTEYFRLGTRWYGLEFPAESIRGAWPIPRVASTVKDEAACQSWLEELMSGGSQQEEIKSYYQEEAALKFNTGTKAFNRAWGGAKVKTNNANWGKPGKKKSQPPH